MTARFFDTSTNHKNPLARAIGNYTVTEIRQQYKKTKTCSIYDSTNA
jgi:hypothetical protein